MLQAKVDSIPIADRLPRKRQRLPSNGSILTARPAIPATAGLCVLGIQDSPNLFSGTPILEVLGALRIPQPEGEAAMRDLGPPTCRLLDRPTSRSHPPFV